MSNVPDPNSPRMATRAAGLPFAARLGEFEITGVLGKGGFSVVYTARDHSLGRTVAIKEYMPNGIATCMPDGTVTPKSPKDADAFKAGLASFLNEARLLAQFTHPALVHIYRVWEQNGTAYIAMQHCVGKTLSQISRSEPAKVKDEGWLKVMLTPVLDALELLHVQNCFHRDISPDNILVLQDGKPVLLDFGAARQIIGDMTQALTVVLKPGFAPVEQYADDSSSQQGPWTDIYGVGAVLYYLLTGKPPVASVARVIKDPIAKLADSNELAGISRSFREGIDRALAVFPNQRIQSIAELREALQLPTFKPDVQTSRAFGAPVEVLKTVPEEIPHMGRLEGSAEAQQPPASRPGEQIDGTPDAPIIDAHKASSREIPSLGGSDKDSETWQLPPSKPIEQTGNTSGTPLKVHESVPGKNSLAGHTGTSAKASQQLPSFKLGKQTGNTSETPLEILGTTYEEEPSPDSIDSVELDGGDSTDTSPPPVSVQAPLPRQKVRETLNLNPAAAAKLIRPSSFGLRNTALAIGVVIVGFAIAFGFSHKPKRVATAVNEGQHIAVNPTPTPVKEVSKPSSPVVALPAQLPTVSPASVAAVSSEIANQASASQEAKPETSITTASNDAQKQSPTSKVNTPPIEDKPAKVFLPSDAAMTNKKALTSLVTASSTLASRPIISVVDSSPPTTSAQTGQQIKISTEHKPVVAASESTLALSSKTSFVRLSIEPWGQIAVDGQPKGISPPLIRLPLTLGDHVITITNGKFPPATIPVTVTEKGDAVVSYQFQ